MERHNRNEMDLRKFDSLLDQPGQAFVREAVRSMPDDSLSLSWRSALNEKLLAESEKKVKRRRFQLVWRPAFGLAVAGALATMWIIRPDSAMPGISSPSNRAEMSLEAALVDAHRLSSLESDVAGTGLRPLEQRYVTRNVSQDFELPDWNEIDIDSL